MEEQLRRHLCARAARAQHSAEIPQIICDGLCRANYRIRGEESLRDVKQLLKESLRAWHERHSRVLLACVLGMPRGGELMTAGP